jgi:hypothetical protein
MDTVSIFCAIDDFCKLFEPRWRQVLLAAASKQRDRKLSLCLSEVLTIIAQLPQLEVKKIGNLLIFQSCTFKGRHYKLSSQLGDGGGIRGECRG